MCKECTLLAFAAFTIYFMLLRIARRLINGESACICCWVQFHVIPKFNYYYVLLLLLLLVVVIVVVVVVVVVI
jgi:hypothetical protein